MLALGCAASITPAAAPKTEKFPDWYREPPSTPGRAYWGVGAGRTPGNLGRARVGAEKHALADLWDTVRTSVQSALAEYLRQTAQRLPPGGPTNPSAPSGPDEVELDHLGLAQRVAVAAGRSVIAEATLVDIVIGPAEPTGVRPAYALARVSFEAVARCTYKQAAARWSRIREDPGAPAMLRRILRNQQGATLLETTAGS